MAWGCVACGCVACGCVLLRLGLGCGVASGCDSTCPERGESGSSSNSETEP